MEPSSTLLLLSHPRSLHVVLPCLQNVLLYDVRYLVAILVLLSVCLVVAHPGIGLSSSFAV